MWFQKISVLLPQKGLEISGRRGGGGGGGVSQTQKFKAMYEAKLEFSEGWVGHRANPLRGGGGGGGGVWIFSGTTQWFKTFLQQQFHSQS